mgnify:CR=1 FL=1
MVVDRSELERKRKRGLEFLEQLAHVRLDLVQTVNLLVIRHKHVTIHLVDEHLVDNVLLELTGLLDQVPQANTCALVILLLRIDHVDERAAVLDLVCLVLFDACVAWKVHDVKLDVFVVRHWLAVHGHSRQQEERLVRRHLLEHHFRN